MIISLIGFMGTGKSTVGKELSLKLNFQFSETDDQIEKKAGMSISKIFENYGENYFRQLEKEVLQTTIFSKDDLVLSTGGGIVLSAENRRLLAENTIPILLTASEEEIYKRVQGEVNRPLLDVEDPLEEIRTLLKKRDKYYNDFNTRIETDGLKIDDIVQLIIGRLGVGAESKEEVSKGVRTEKKLR